MGETPRFPSPLMGEGVGGGEHDGLPPHLDPPPQGGRKIFRAFYFLSNLEIKF